LFGIVHSLSAVEAEADPPAGAVDDAGAEPELHAAATTENAKTTRINDRDVLLICAPLQGG
jgi:hypothetical protein